jgi:cyclase
MSETRVIPVLLLSGKGLVKTVKFKRPCYIGDPINSVRIFNEKEVDELLFLDITATTEGRGPDFELLANIAGEAFMPMAYGGGIKTMDDVSRIFSLGFEKVIINTASYMSPQIIQDAVGRYGSQSVVCCIDVKRSLFGGTVVVSHAGKKRQPHGLVEHATNLQQLGVGEIIVQSVDRDGTFSGYDCETVSRVSAAVSIPVIACGGASSLEDFALAIKTAGASAVAAGSMFVYMGPHKAVLISYPSRSDLSRYLP